MAIASVEAEVAAFLDGLQAVLEAKVASGVPPRVRRKLKSVTKECGHKGSVVFLEELDRRLAAVGIYSEPRLADPGLHLDEWVRFSTEPFPPDPMYFPTEDHLRQFVEASLGRGVFRHLEQCTLEGKSGREFPLPGVGKIDLLCQERSKAGKGALVAIEFKRAHQGGIVEQLARYIDALRQRHPERKVKGIIVSGREDEVAVRLRAGDTYYEIEWLCYQVEFTRLSKSG